MDCAQQRLLSLSLVRNSVALHSLIVDVLVFVSLVYLFLWLSTPWHTGRSLHYTPMHAFISLRPGGELPAPLHQEGTQPPRVHGLHYGFLLSLELERVLPIRLNGKKRLRHKAS